MNKVFEKIFDSIADRIIEELVNYSLQKMATEFVIVKILRKFDIIALSKDFNSIYINSLIEWALSPQKNKRIIELFASRAVRSSLEDELSAYNNNFENTLLQYFDSQEYYSLRIEASADTIKKECVHFKEIFKRNASRAESPADLIRDNEIRKQFSALLKDNETEREERIKKSFPFQINNHLERIISENKEDTYVQSYGIELKFRQILGFERFSNLQDSIIKNYSGWVSPELRNTIEKFNIIEGLMEWIKASNENFLFLIGEYGIGKTTTLNFLNFRLSKDYFQDKEIDPIQQRIPILFSLKDHDKKIKDFIISSLNEYGIKDIDYPQFIDKLNSGNLILILDGFDEMSNNMTFQDKIRNFELIQGLIQSKKAKVILSIRKEFFESQDQFYNTLKLGMIKGYSVYEVLPFEDDQINEFIRIKEPTQFNQVFQKIKEIHDLSDLSKRPVLLDLILKNLSSISNSDKDKILSVDLYKFCIDNEIQRKFNDVNFNFNIPTPKKIMILENICLWMLNNNAFSFSIRNPEINLSQYFIVTDNDRWNYEKYVTEFLTFTFLINDNEGTYRISHKSFRDYFIARRYFNELTNATLNEKISIGQVQSSHEIDQFIVEMGLTYQTIISFLDNITEVIRNYPKANPLNPYTYSNCINLLLKIENQNYKRNIDFNNANINLSRSGLTNIKSLSYLTFIFDNQKTFISSLILDLSNNEIIDISAFKFLGEVNIDMLVLDNNYLENIDALRGLRINKISIKNNKLSGVFNFSGFERLLSLNLTKNTLNEFIISDFYKSNSTIDGYKLQTLNISMNKFTSIDFVAGLKKLKFFNFSNNKINVLTPLFYHKALTNVSLKNNVFGENDINELKRKNPSILIESLWIYQRISINNTQERIWEKIVSADSFGLWNSIPFYSKIWFNIPEKDTIIDVDYDAHIKVINNSEKKKIIQFKLLSREWSFEQREPDIELQVSLSLDNKNKATYVNIKFGDFLDIPNGEIFYQHYEKEVIESLQRLKTIVE